MVEEQLKTRGIVSPEVLSVMAKVPRHIFVDIALEDNAYSDGPLPIGHGQSISQPYIVAVMTQALALKETDRVLEIGFGCGYQTAILAQLAKEVYAVERIASLFEKGRMNLKSLGIQNVTLKLGDGTCGWSEYAPFDAILVAAYTEKVPEILRTQLGEGGRLVIPLGDVESQILVLYEKGKYGEVKRSVITLCRFVPLMKGVKNA
jgi:protein-L-isoaspartate(D-aspartate) O-methyltransferase